MNRNKICPHCETEYLPNIEKCADCGAILILSEEFERNRQDIQQTLEKAVEDAVIAKEGDLEWIKELYAVLIETGIPCAIHADTGCRKGRCRSESQLLVSTDNLERAQDRIEEYFIEKYPEMRDSKKRAEEGKCPACGYAIRSNDRQCPDCGLMFVVDDDSEEEN